MRSRNRWGAALTAALLTLTLAAVPAWALTDLPAQAGSPGTQDLQAGASAAPADQTDQTPPLEPAAPDLSATAKIMLTGDLMCQPVQQSVATDGKGGYDFTPTFQYVKQIFDQADLVIGNLETLVSENLPLSKDLRYVHGKPYLNAPTEFLDALKYAGFDGFITANNHCCDGGVTGITDTLDMLDEYGFVHTGMFRSPDEQRYILQDVNGIKVGILSYGIYFNLKDKFLTAEQQTYMLNRTTQEALERDVKALREAGAEYIIAYNHCGTEYSQTPAKRQRNYASMMAKAGVDHIISSHPHVLQPYETIRVNRKDYPVMFSMGNFVSAMTDHAAKETIILSLTLKRDAAGKVSLASQYYYPCYMLDEYQGDSFVLMPQSSKYNGDFEETASDRLKKQLKEHFVCIRDVVGKLD